jgi:hypothetical protein
MTRNLFVIAFALICWNGTSQAEEIRVVTNPDLAIAEVELIDLQRLYLGRSNQISGQTVTPLDLPEKSKTREQFYTQTLKRSPEQMNRYWARALFTGNATPPREVPSTKEMVEVISSEPAIGYLPADHSTDSVKVIETK